MTQLQSELVYLNKIRSPDGYGVCLLATIALMLLSTLSGCGWVLNRLQCVDVEFWIRISGELVDEETGEPLANVPVGGRSFTEGVEVGNVAAQADGIYFSDDTGAFTLLLSDLSGFCNGEIVRDRLFRTDHIEIIVLRDGCEQRVMAEVDTPVETDDPTVRVIELKDPIVVAPCP